MSLAPPAETAVPDTDFERQARRYADAATISAWRDVLTPLVPPGGERVVFLVDNQNSHAALLLVLLGRGISPLVLPPESTADEIAHYARLLGASIVLKLDAGDVLLAERLPRAEAPIERPDEEGGLYLYLLTSGSTGKPALVARGIDSWHDEANRYLKLLRLTSSHDILLATPIYHAYGLGWLWAAIIAGCGLEILKPAQLGSIVNSLRNRATHCALTPFVASLLARRAAPFPRPDRLEVVMAGAGPVDEALEMQFRNAFGLGLSRNYGSTESGATFAGIAPLPPLCIGHPMPGLTVVAAGPTDRPFELVVRLENGGIHQTGDIAREDDHGYHIIGRKTAAIRRGESWISAFEIEDTLRKSPLVEDCQVRGIRSRRNAGNDHIIASIVPASGETWDEAELREYCRSRLSGNKVPDIFEVVEAIRRGNNGKAIASPVYRLSSADVLIEAATAYKRSVLLFSLLQTSVLERIDGTACIDEIAYETGMHADALMDFLTVAESVGLARLGSEGEAAPLSQDLLDLVELEAKAARYWNDSDGLAAILRGGRHGRPSDVQPVPEDFSASYRRAMAGPHKQRSIRLALRKLERVLPRPFSALDVSATAGAYSAALLNQGLLACGRYMPAGSLTGGMVPEGVELLNLQDAAWESESLDVLILDNAIHHHEIASRLPSLTSSLKPSGVVVLDELFLGATPTAVGVDWLTHGGMSHTEQKSVDFAMSDLGFRKEEIMKSDFPVVHTLSIYSRK